MRSIIIIITAGFAGVFLMLCVGPSGAQELETGFMGRQWGTGISAQDGFERLYVKNDVAYYARPGQVYTIGDTTVPDVIYGFYQDRFFAVYFSVDSLDTFDRIQEHLRSQYGLPDESTEIKSGVTVYKWKTGDTKIKLKSYEKSRKMKLAYYYAPLSTQLYEKQVEELEQLHESKSFQLFPIEKDKQYDAIPLFQW